jgi:hypothetical protein
MPLTTTQWPARFAWLYLVGLTLVLCLLAYPPLADFVEWEYQAFIASKLMAGQAAPGFYLRDYPVPYLSSQLLMAVIGVATGPIVAGKLTLAVYLLLGGWLSKRLVDRHELSAPLAYPLLIACVVCNSTFWSGYLNYQFGLLVIMGYLGLNTQQQRKMWINAVFALLAFACHGFCLIAFCLMGGLMALAQGLGPALRFTAACLPAVGLTLWYLLAHDNDAVAMLEAPVRYGTLKFLAYKLYTLAKAGPYHNFMFGDSVDASRSPAFYWLGVGTNGLVAGLLLVIEWLALRQWRETQAKGLVWAAMALGLIVLLLPSVALQVVNPGERLMYPQLLVAFTVGLRKDQIHIKWPKWNGPAAQAIGALVMVMAFGTVGNLLATTVNRGYETVSSAQLSSATKHPAQVLFWHRPYQFKSRFDYFHDAYGRQTSPKLRLIFPTSLVGNTKIEKPATQAGSQ